MAWGFIGSGLDANQRQLSCSLRKWQAPMPGRRVILTCCRQVFPWEVRQTATKCIVVHRRMIRSEPHSSVGARGFIGNAALIPTFLHQKSDWVFHPPSGSFFFGSRAGRNRGTGMENRGQSGFEELWPRHVRSCAYCCSTGRVHFISTFPLGQSWDFFVATPPGVIICFFGPLFWLWSEAFPLCLPSPLPSGVKWSGKKWVSVQHDLVTRLVSWRR